MTDAGLLSQSTRTPALQRAFHGITRPYCGSACGAQQFDELTDNDRTTAGPTSSFASEAVYTIGQMGVAMSVIRRVLPLYHVAVYHPPLRRVIALQYRVNVGFIIVWI